MKKTKVICVGEALIDRIKNKSNEDFTASLNKNKYLFNEIYLDSIMA